MASCRDCGEATLFDGVCIDCSNKRFDRGAPIKPNNVITPFYTVSSPELEEILACMEDSDRYISESRKANLIKIIKQELVERGLTQYSDEPLVKSVE